MSERLLKYGIKDGRLISIEEVVSGMGCGCFCPSCGAVLVAKKGLKREHHFAHYNANDCKHGSESALHLMAKNTMASLKCLFVPDMDDSSSGSVRDFSAVELESRSFQSFIPDIVLKNNDEILCVEILVTHAVDEEKEKKIERSKIPTVEIDLGGMLESFDEKSITEVFLSGRLTKWVYNSVIAERLRKERIEKELSDLLPPIGSVYTPGSEWYDCPRLKRKMSFFYGKDSCHDCWYFNHLYPFKNYTNVLQCIYRESDLLKQKVEDVRNVVRESESGLLLSVDILVDKIWQHWEGSKTEKLSLLKANGY
ncbi:MAG: hypothetical protein J5874_01405 [Oscillospiraceae bacterium]|nr:hypothetical protein [Oscillospiraceae bacterium]